MILDKIKSRTAQSHQRVEQSEVMRPITDRSLTPENYARMLRKFYGFFHPLENKINRIDRICQILPDYPQRRKSVLLQADLVALQPAAGTSLPLPVCPDLPALASLDQAMGCLYVLEGSTLGGRFISKVLQQTLGVDQDSGGSFFYGYGAGTGTRWKIFQEALQQYSRQSGEEAAIISSAEDTFVTFEKWLNQN